MYQIERYIDANTRGTASLLDILVNEEHDVKKLVVASSMSVYGEGKYYCEKCATDVHPGLRNEEQLAKGRWDHVCQTCGSSLKPLPTDEDKPLMPTSIYALSKRHQEETCLLTGRTYGIPVVALRYFNVYGPRQSLNNPYTGVCAIFSSRILNNNPPYVFEDGKQTRDFIHVRDVAKANLQALERNGADYMTVNVGTGKPIPIIKLAEILTELYGAKLKPYISGKYRKGDIRHCYADIQRIRELLDFKPTINLRDGLVELAEWAKTHRWGAVDLFNRALDELTSRQLTT
jgi:dTDP-L-rhamnose 4-epimerase